MDVMAIMKLVHMAWSGCIIPRVTSYYLIFKNWLNIDNTLSYSHNNPDTH